MAFLGKFSLFVVLLGGCSTVASREIPSTLQSFYDHVRDKGACSSPLASGFHSADGDSGDFEYCGDFLDEYGIIYLQGKKGQLVNLDVDCDGVQGGPADDGRCESSDDTQSVTSFQWVLEEYEQGQEDLDANVHPYVVFGNEGEKKGWPTFDPEEHGIEPLSLMAVVCGDKLVYGIWGDTNGDDGDEAMVGEASISMATACFGDSLNGNSGHDDNDVLFIAFTGKEAVPGADGADWNATSFDKFESSISDLGDELVERVGSAGVKLWWPANGLLLFGVALASCITML